MILKVVRTQKNLKIQLSQDSAGDQCTWDCKENMDALEWVKQKARHD